jgi:hypothetical protein
MVGGDVNKLPAIGSRVRVMYGRIPVEGEVINAYDSGFGGQVMISILLGGTDEPVTPTFSVESVEPVEPAA